MKEEQEKKGTVLVVDDSPGNIDILNAALSEEYNVIIATSGEKALGIAEMNPPDLILLDIMMPGMDGYEVCLRLKHSETTSSIPVIFITSLNETEKEEQGFEVGCVDYLTKPIVPGVALARVKTHIAIRHSQKELEEWNNNLKGRVKALSSLVTGKVQELASVEVMARKTGGLQ